ncbi:MAG: SDR family NAD(P)-dependent oxidoreductase [Myxococcota bacterium]
MSGEPIKVGAKKARDFRERYGPVALVTGAAQGIGRAFADSVAARGLSVLMVDVQEEALDVAAREVAETYEVSTWAVPTDLARRDFLGGIDAICSRVGLEVGLVICNAALGLEGPFLEADLETLHRAEDVSCHATTALAHHFGRGMAERGRGGLLFVSSGTALQGAPNHAHYAATKAFVLVLGESLWYELQPKGVDVLAFVPGPTNTPGLRSSLTDLEEGVAVGPIGLPRDTAETAVDALGKKATAARERVHANRLASRRRAADEFVEHQAKQREPTDAPAAAPSSAAPEGGGEGGDVE